MKQIYLFILFLLLPGVSLHAQSGNNSATAGKEFYITFANNNNEVTTLQLKVVVEKACFITAKYNNQASSYWNNWNNTWVTPGIYTNNVSYNDVLNTNTGITSKTITLTSTENVSVYAINYAPYTTDATCILPVSAWGTEYRLATGHGPIGGYSTSNYYSAVAHENDTWITLHDNTNIQLSKNEVYHFYSTSVADMTGQKVTSTKPIALFSGSVIAMRPGSSEYGCSSGIGLGLGSGDHTYEQLWSTEKWGKDFFAFPILTPGDCNWGGMLGIVADENETSITLSGGISDNYTLNAGEKQYVCHVMPGLTKIVSTKPIMVFLMLPDATVTNIVPVAQRIQHATVAPFILTGNTQINQHGIDMLVPAEWWEQTVIKENGAVVSNTTYTVNSSVHFSDWYHIRKNLPNVNVTIDITCPGGFLAYLSGNGDSESYAFVAGTGAYDLQNYFTIQEKATDIDTYYENTTALTHTFNASDIIVVKRTVEKSFTSIKWLINGIQHMITENFSSMNTLNFPASALSSGENSLTMAVRYAGATQDSLYTGKVWLLQNECLNLHSTGTSSEGCLELEWHWNPPPPAGTYGFTLYQWGEAIGEWQTASTNYDKTIQVLNVYPDIAGSNTLQAWMNDPAIGLGKIIVTPITITNFNANPNGCLKDASGEYIYDAIMFGSWDSNNNKDLTPLSANVVREFLNSGRGVIFGHDTQTFVYPNFTSLCDKTNLISQASYGRRGTSKIKVVNDGFLLKYPHLIPYESILDIPCAHSSYQLACGVVWMNFHNLGSVCFNDPEITTPQGTNNFYLTTWNNAAMIQTRHSNGESTLDERKVIANTLWYVAQFTTDTTAKICSALDLAAPDPPALNRYDCKYISIISTDNGTPYSFYVKATNTNNYADTCISNILNAVNKSGLKGFYVLEDNNPNGIPTPSNPATLFIAATDNQLVTYTAIDLTKYVHVQAIDSAGNLSEVVTLNPPETYNVVLSEEPSVGGSTSGGATNIICGDEITITATPNPGYLFLYWKHEDGTWFSDDASHSFYVTENLNLVAHFLLNVFDIILLKNPDAGGNVSGGGTAIIHGTSTTISATPNVGYDFLNWTINTPTGPVFTTSADTTFVVTQNLTLVANFKVKTYPITLLKIPSYPNPGTLTCNYIPVAHNVPIIVAHWTNATFTATPNLYNNFDRWTEADSTTTVSNNPSFTHTVEGPHTFIAHFAPKTFDVTVTADPPQGGTACCDTTDLPYGTIYTVTATAYEHWVFTHWTEGDNGTPISQNPVFNLTANRNYNLVAHFEPEKYSVILIANPETGGMVYGHAFNIPHGTDTSALAVPFSNYNFACWTDLDGNPVSYNTLINFIVTGHVTLIANFTPKHYQITVEPSPPGGGMVSGGGSYYFYGDSCTITATPNGIYKFVKWIEIGDPTFVSYDSAYTFIITRPRDFRAIFELKSFHVYLAVHPSTGGTAEGGGNYIQFGDSITVIAHPNMDFVFDKWTEDSITGTHVSNDAVFTFNVTRSLLLIAHFVPKTYTINLFAETPSGGFVEGGGENIPYGTEITVTATPNDNYHFVGWFEDNILIPAAGPVYIFPVTRSRDLTAVFALNTYLITVEAVPPQGGEVAGGGNLLFGTTATVIAVPCDFCTFDRWTKDSVGGPTLSVDPSFDFSVTQSLHLVANFICQTFDILLLANPTDGGTVEGGGTEITYMTQITVSATPEECYDFVEWTNQNGITLSTDANYTFFVTENLTLTAQFVRQEFIVTAVASPPEGGEVSIDTAWFACGDTLTVTATPYTGYQFISWTKEGEPDPVSYSPDYTFVVMDSCHLVAHFEYKEYLILLKPSPFGHGTADTSGIYPLNYDLTVHAKPHPEYKFDKWTDENDNPVSIEADYSFIVNANRTLTAHFIPNTFDITLTARPYYGGEVEGECTNIAYDSIITIIAIPNEHFIFVNWTEDGYPHPFSSLDTFSFPVTRSFDFIANFKPKKYTINLTPNIAAGGILYGGGIFDYGDVITITADPNTNYIFRDWTFAENDSVFSIDNELEFTVQKSLNLIANFVPEGFNVQVVASPPSGGTVSGGGEDIPYNTEITVSATPAQYYTFVGWKEDSINSPFIYWDTTFTFKVIKSHNLIAVFTLETYNITVFADPHPGGTVQGDAYNLPFGTDTVVRAFPNINYDFFRWTEDTVPVAWDLNYSFTVNANRQLTAHFIPKHYNVMLEASPLVGGVVEGNENDIPYMEPITIKATPKSNYVFEKWMEWVEDSLVHFSFEAEYTFPVTKSYHLVAIFKLATYHVILGVYPPEAGTADSTEFNIPYGTIKAIKAYPNERYHFDCWREDGPDGPVVCPTSDFEFQVTSSRYLVATFTSETHLITLISAPSGGGTLLGGGNIPVEHETTIRAVPDGCYEFVEWRDDRDSLVTTQSEFQLIVTEPRTFVAYFLKHTLDITTSANPPEGGTVVGEFHDLFCGTPVTVYAYPNPENYFINWTIDSVEVSKDSEYTFPAAASCNLVANFATTTYTITLLADPPEMGTVEGGGEIPYGREITAKALPYEGYSFIHWTEDSAAVSTDAHYSFIVQHPRTLTAHFEKTMYIVTVEVNDTVYGYATGGGRFDLNETATVRAFSKQGYQFVNWTINDEIVAEESVYSFSVTESVTIVANFYGLEFDEYAATLWDNTFMLNLKKLEEEEYEIVDCQWYKNGKELVETNTLDAYSYSAGPNPEDLLELAPSYYTFTVTTKNGARLNSTKKVITEYKFHYTPLKGQLLVYPNPVSSGSRFTIEGVTEGTLIEVFSQTGVCVSRSIATDKTATLVLQLPAGVYIIRNHNKEAKLTIVR